MQKGPIFRLGLLLYLMSGSLWRASCPPPSGPLLRNVQIRSRWICPPQESTHRQTTDKNKRPSLSTEPFVLFDVWQFPTLAWGDPTLPSALRRFTSEFGMGSGGTTALLPPDKFFFKCRTLTVLSGADTQSRTGDLTLTKGALYQLSHISTLNLMPGSSLLSHGETPHYHRRYGVSLLSSAWGQVGPPRYCRQANSLCSVLCLLH